MAYKRYIWVDEESQLDAYHLNNIEDGIESIIDGDLTVDKANKDGDGNIITGSYGSNVNFEFDHGTGIVTLKLLAKDGTILQTSSIDLPTEYLIKQIYLDDADKNLVFVLSNDTEIKCDISAIYDKIDTKADKAYVDDIRTDLDTKLDTKLDKEYIVLTNTVIAYAEKINDDDAIILTNLYNKYEGITPEIPLFVRDKNNNIALLSFYSPHGLRFQVISNVSDTYFPIVTWQIGTIKSFSGNGKYYLHNILGQNAWKESVTAYIGIDSDYKLVLANNNEIIIGQNNRSVVVPPFTYNSFDTFTLGSNLTITGNLSVSGTTTTVDTETLKVKDNVIVTNSDKNKLIDLSGLAINTDETNTFGIMYDPKSNTVDLGLGTITTEGKFTFNENEGLPLAIRDRNSSFTQDHLISWSTDKNKLVDSGIDKSVIDNKVDKVEKGIYWQVYGIGTEGAPLPENDGKTINATQEAVPNTLINRDAGGVAQVNTPQSDKDIANKLYVDGRMDYIVFNDTIFSARSTLTQTEYNNLYAFYDKHYNKDKIPLFAIDKNGSIALVSFEPLKWVDFTLFNDKLSPITLTIQVSTDTGHSKQFSYNSGYLHNILGQDVWKQDINARIGVNSDNKLIITDGAGNQTPGQTPSVLIPPFTLAPNGYYILDTGFKVDNLVSESVSALNELIVGSAEDKLYVQQAINTTNSTFEIRGIKLNDGGSPTFSFYKFRIGEGFGGVVATLNDLANYTPISETNDIKALIPPQANKDNQLADKNFVNSSINNLETEVSRTNDDISQLNSKVSALQNATGGEITNPTGLTSCLNRYKGNKSQVILELTTLDTSKVTHMGGMFYNCISLTSIPLLDTSKVTTMSDMFNGCKSLTAIPQLNTSNVTIMNAAFYNCISLTSIALLDTSKVTRMDFMFYNCISLISIPSLDTSNVTNMGYMFSGCKSLTTIPFLNTNKVTNMDALFNWCKSLTSIPLLDTSKITKMDSMFYNCISLISIPSLDTSNVTSMANTFDHCAKLTSIKCYGMKVNFNISFCTLLNREALVEILNNLATVTTTQTLTMGSKNLAKLTDEDKAIATNKGWTLA